jgi:hypothetical protein
MVQEKGKMSPVMPFENARQHKERIGDPWYCQRCFHSRELHSLTRKYKNKSHCHGWKPNKALKEQCNCVEFVRVRRIYR